MMSSLMFFSVSFTVFLSAVAVSTSAVSTSGTCIAASVMFVSSAVSSTTPWSTMFKLMLNGGWCGVLMRWGQLWASLIPRRMLASQSG